MPKNITVDGVKYPVTEQPCYDMNIGSLRAFFRPTSRSRASMYATGTQDCGRAARALSGRPSSRRQSGCGLGRSRVWAAGIFPRCTGQALFQRLHGRLRRSLCCAACLRRE